MFLVGNLSQPKSIGNSSWMDLQALNCSLNASCHKILFLNELLGIMHNEAPIWGCL
jgi:hypothetical protein